VAESIEQLSFELIRNELEEQERALSGLRTCAGVILAAASIAGSVPVARDSHGSPAGWSILAVISFALCSACAIWVLLPHRFVFALRGDALLTVDAHGRTRDITEAYRAVTAWSKLYAHANNGRIARLSDWLTASGMLLSIEILLRVVNLIG